MKKQNSISAVNHDFLTDSYQMWVNHKWIIVLIFSLMVLMAVFVIKYVFPELQKKLVGLDNFYKSFDNQQQTAKASKPKIRNKYETRCRQILEKIFNKPFPSIRPDWLKNPKTGRNLELDCYNKELNLALEFDGDQHAHFSYHFHKTAEAFEYQQWKDKYKRQICSKLKIQLITVPHTVQYDDLQSYIINELDILYSSKMQFNSVSKL